MTDKEFQAMLNGKPINWGSGERALQAIEKYKNRKNQPDEIKKENKEKRLEAFIARYKRTIETNPDFIWKNGGYPD